MLGIYTAHRQVSAAAPDDSSRKLPVSEQMAVSSRYEALLSAISSLCDGKINTRVDFESVRRKLGTKEEIKKLGWNTFTSYVKAASHEKVVELVEIDPTTKFLVILPRSILGTKSAITVSAGASSSPEPINPPLQQAIPHLNYANDQRKASPTKYSTVDFPQRHTAVVSVLIKLTDGIPGKQVRMYDLTSSLRVAFPSTKPADLFSLVVDAEEATVLKRSADQMGIVWAALIPLSREPEVSISSPKSDVR